MSERVIYVNCVIDLVAFEMRHQCSTGDEVVAISSSIVFHVHRQFLGAVAALSCAILARKIEKGSTSCPPPMCTTSLAPFLRGFQRFARQVHPLASDIPGRLMAARVAASSHRTCLDRHVTGSFEEWCGVQQSMTCVDQLLARAIALAIDECVLYNVQF
eukprot:TRINITY_DN5255_c0_g1_i2.p1 TRINITY_DN5255_c0_g1~~TRINITY_DN5255_c0_g1_i2.p1  ORF type:complete len:159 (-),score=10.91 TRINITY_DN5255_c0_g1_i2:167-643(-)